MSDAGVGIRHAVFRADATPTIGGGHLARCLCLAEALAQHGWHSTLLTNVGGKLLMPAHATGRWRALELEKTRADDAVTLDTIVGAPVDLAVIDHYGLGADFEAGCRAWARRVLAFDDRPTRPHDCDFLVDQTAGRQSSEYAALVPDGTVILTGSDYAQIARAFVAKRAHALERRRTRSPAKHLVISLGATDPQNVTGRALAELAHTRWDGTITVILGPAAPHLDMVRGQASAMARTRLLVGLTAEEIATELAAADIAIGAGGVSTWERCCLGVPTLLLVVADNQMDIAQAVERARAAKVVGPLDELPTGAIASEVTILANDDARLRQMSERAAQLCDGEGADRLADIIERDLH